MTLVERLRDDSDRIGWWDATGTWVDGGALLREAADAIEKAERLAEAVSKYIADPDDLINITPKSEREMYEALLAYQNARSGVQE